MKARAGSDVDMRLPDEPDPAPSATPAGQQPDDSDLRLGESVRLLRQRLGLSIQEVGRRTGLSNGMISQLERGLATPSIRTLRLLSLALQVPISYFFENRAEPPAAPYIVRRAQRRLLRLTASGVLKESLAPNIPGEMEMYELTLNPGGTSGPDFVRHQGEKAGYVLAGRLRLWLDHEAHLLEPGDSFRFPSLVPHMFDNPAEEPARIVWISCRTRPDE
jgi:transcriptional regulator with XRE-family HTH domain